MRKDRFVRRRFLSPFSLLSKVSRPRQEGVYYSNCLPSSSPHLETRLFPLFPLVEGLPTETRGCTLLQLPSKLFLSLGNAPLSPFPLLSNLFAPFARWDTVANGRDYFAISVVRSLPLTFTRNQRLLSLLSKVSRPRQEGVYYSNCLPSSNQTSRISTTGMTGVSLFHPGGLRSLGGTPSRTEATVLQFSLLSKVSRPRQEGVHYSNCLPSSNQTSRISTTGMTGVS
jgi:hypothetical protein